MIFRDRAALHRRVRLYRGDEEADHVVCHTVAPLRDGIGRWYSDFAEVFDAEVLALLAGSTAARAGD